MSKRKAPEDFLRPKFKRARTGFSSFEMRTNTAIPAQLPTSDTRPHDPNNRATQPITLSLQESNFPPTKVTNHTVGTAAASNSQDNIKSRLLIISGTHAEFGPENEPCHRADVAIHCGDLTDESKIEEFRSALRLLKDINSPLKLVIPGNHDFTMDIPNFKKKISEAQSKLDQDDVVKAYGDFGAAKQLFEEARSAGIILLEEGTHKFTLDNGARLTVYASPFTPSLGDWGFQYHPEHGHDYHIEKGVDVVITHGPPKGIMDRTESRQRAGSPRLFRAIAHARPRLHCFGHIHEGWGAKLVAWKDQVSETLSFLDAIDNERSVLVESLASLKGSKFDTPEMVQEKEKKLERYTQDRCCTTSHCNGDTNPLQLGEQTVFVNAAVESISEELPTQLPWLIDIELPRASNA